MTTIDLRDGIDEREREQMKMGVLAVAKELPKRLKEHNLVVIAAGIAFYGLLALAPTMIALVSTYSLVTPADEVASQITDLTENIESSDTRDVLQSQLQTAVEEAEGAGYTALALGILLALFSASGAVQKLMQTVGLAYEADEERKGWQVRGLAYLMTAGAIVGVVLLSFLLGAVPALASTVGLSDAASTAVTIAAYPIAFVAMAFGLTVLYRYAPDRAPKTKWFNVGAVVGTLLFLLFAFAFTMYFRIAGSMPDSYGILGTVAALIIFLQLATLAVILGAETNSILEGYRATGVAPEKVDKKVVRVPTEPLSFGKAAAGIAALLVLGRGSRD